MKTTRPSRPLISVQAQENIRIIAFFLLIAAILSAALISMRKVSGTATYYYYGGQLIYGGSTIFHLGSTGSSSTTLTFNFWVFLSWVLFPLASGVLGLVRMKNFRLQMTLCLGLAFVSLVLLTFVPTLVSGGASVPWLGLWLTYLFEAGAVALYACGFFRSLKGWESHED